MMLQDYGKVEIVCIVAHLNRRRYYCVSVEPGLFGPVLVRTWGRIGWRKLRRIEQFFPEGELGEALERANRVLEGKIRKGYGGYGLTVKHELADPRYSHLKHNAGFKHSQIKNGNGLNIVDFKS